jgi:YVTN family beta-propeller protein
MKLILWLVVFTSSLIHLEAQDKKKFHIVKTFPVLSDGGWDYLIVGPANNRLYVSHGTRVNILDKMTGDSIGVIENTIGVHGIAFDKVLNKGFTSNGGLNTVTVFDLNTNQVIAQIATGQNPDAILYEPYSKQIITCNGTSNDLSILDPLENKLVATIPVGGKPETAVSNQSGLLFVNIEDKNEIVVVNLKTNKIESHISLAPGEEPTGLAFDKKANRLFAASGNKFLMVVNASTGAITNKLAIGEGCDGVALDTGTKNIFTSNGEGTMSVFHQLSADTYEMVETAITKRGARTITVDEETHLVYLPTADFEKELVPVPKSRPTRIPGSFQVLVMGQ